MLTPTFKECSRATHKHAECCLWAAASCNRRHTATAMMMVTLRCNHPKQVRQQTELRKRCKAAIMKERRVCAATLAAICVSPSCTKSHAPGASYSCSRNCTLTHHVSMPLKYVSCFAALHGAPSCFLIKAATCVWNMLSNQSLPATPLPWNPAHSTTRSDLGSGRTP